MKWIRKKPAAVLPINIEDKSNQDEQTTKLKSREIFDPYKAHDFVIDLRISSVEAAVQPDGKATSLELKDEKVKPIRNFDRITETEDSQFMDQTMYTRPMTGAK